MQHTDYSIMIFSVVYKNTFKLSNTDVLHLREDSDAISLPAIS